MRHEAEGIGEDVVGVVGRGLRVELRWRGRRGRVKVLSRVLVGKLRLIDCCNFSSFHSLILPLDRRDRESRVEQVDFEIQIPFLPPLRLSILKWL